MSFKRVRQVFIPSTRPDHFAGFPGFYMSAREGLGGQIEQLNEFKFKLIGPQGMDDLFKLTGSFLGDISSMISL
jgi:ribonuclease BN (tRNA processing enzyme)